MKKFLSKISIFDFILLSVVALFAVLFFVFFHRKAEFVNIRVSVTDRDVLYAQVKPKSWYAGQFQVGDVEKDTIGQPIAEIVNVETFNVTAEEKAVYLDIKVKATYDSRTQQYSSRGRVLNFGAPMRFNFSKVTFDGIVTDFPGSDTDKNVQKGQTVFEGIVRAIEPSLAASIKKGDQVVDSNQHVLAEVTNVEVRPAEKVTPTAQGELLLKKDPLYKDVLITVRVETKFFAHELYAFDFFPVKIGQKIPLNFKEKSILPTITNVYSDPAAVTSSNKE
jgi:hypothetical protein